MRNYSNLLRNNPCKTSWNIFIILLLLNVGTIMAQVRVPFSQRTSVYTPTKRIYNVKGDFTMIGNSNLTLVNYGVDTPNSNNDMRYVDIDGDASTWNSSSSTLTFSNENGAQPSCSNIIYAGLYWTGRASNGINSPNIFSVDREVPGVPQAINNNQTIGHNEDITYTQYDMEVTRQGSNNNYYVRYEFAGNGNTYQFEFQNSAPYIRYRVGTSGGWTNAANQVVTNSGNTRTVTFNPVTIYSAGGVVLTVYKLDRDSRMNRNTGQYESSSFAYTNVVTTIPTTITQTKTFDKRKVSIKGPGAAAYTQVTANAADIYYPVSDDGFMYSAYAEVTDYVRNYGLGEYFVGDVAVVEGNGGSTGYYGGWSLIVVYENSKMKWRDVTLFDGHAYVQGNTTTSFDLPVSGFNAVQTGAVNMKLGLMAGEGDRGISGDYFQIQKVSDNSWMNLNHSGNGTGNFFNSSIETGGNPRNPNIVNNTGLDVSMFNIPNPGNSVIANNQTSTTFRYGSTQDTYVIFAAAMAVDAYVPDAEGVASITSIGGVPAGTGPYTATPGQEIEYKIKVYNEGTEPINNARVSIPIPYSATYVAGSESRVIYFAPAPTPNLLTFDSAGNGMINWEIGTLPVPANPTVLLGELTFKIKITEDCRILTNPNCIVNSTIFGYMYGVGAVTGIKIDTKPFIQGYSASGPCQGEPVTTPLSVTIDSQSFTNQNCQNTSNEIAFSFCDNISTIALSQISGAFPPGTLFYTDYPQTGSPLQSFPATLGTTTYYAVPPAANGCYFVFTISVYSNPTVVEPIDYQLEGCSISSITGLTYSETPVSITLAQFLTAGGTASNQSIPYTITYSDSQSGTCPTIVTRTFSITTLCGNPQQLIQTITIDDTVAPVAPAAPANVNVNCSADVPATISLTATDACNGAITVQGVDSTAPGNCANSFVITRTWTFVDTCGNSSSVSQTINVSDTLAPIAPVAPAPVTVACSADVPAMVSLTATDNCQGAITVQGVDSTVSGNCPNSFVTTRTWTFIDACGNTSSVSQIITVSDTLAPVAPAAPAAVTLACSGDIPAMISLTATDNCQGAITVQGVDSSVPGNCPNSFVTTRTWTFVDACGNTSSVSQTITVSDSLAPVAPVAPASVTISCSADVPPMISLTATDNCQGAITVQGVDATVPGNCPNSFVTTRTWTFVDACGNTSSVSQTINVNDTVAPVRPPFPPDVTVSCGSEVPAMISLTANDACSGLITVPGIDKVIPGQCANSYTIVRSWIFTDACGNTSIAKQTITVNDNIAPVVPTAPANLNLACAAEVPQMISLTANDACSGPITVEGVDVSVPGNCPNSFVITRKWTFTDACGNTSSVLQTINVNDSIAPVAPAAPATVNVACSSAIPTMISLTANDNCQGAITVQGVDSTTPGNCPGSYVITRTWTFADACGNTSSVSQTINVNDTIAPIAPAAPANLNLACSAAVPAMISLTANDNCQGAITVQGVDATVPGNCPNSFVTTRTWTFVDACGNSSTVSQTITVNDNVAPVTPTAPASLTVACSADVPAMISLTATDNCQGAITVQGVDVTVPGNCPNSFVTTRTWTFVDACGNSSSVSQTINVSDTIAPVAPTAPANITVACSGLVPTMIPLTAIDNCNGPIIAQGVDAVTAGNCTSSYTITRTWTFVDTCGNTSSVSQTINVSDTSSPVLPQAPANITVACSSEVPATISLTAVDNCVGNITSLGIDTIVPGNCPNSYVITRTWTFGDLCGNSASVSQTITVNDNIAPVAPAAPASVTLACSADVPAMISLTANDNCQGAITVQGVDSTVPGNCPTSFVITRTWTFADVCGNTSSVSQTINVSDTLAPVAPTAPAPVTLSCSADVPAMISLTATDNCQGTITVQGVDATVPGNCPNSFVTTRTWTFADACGNTSSVSQTITVNDNLAPVAPAAPATLNLACSAEVPAMISLTATDNCQGAITVQGVDSTVVGNCPNSFVTTRTWTFVDACGNTSSVSQTINVSDTLAPVAPAAPASVTLACSADAPAMISLTATDNCQGAITVQGVDATVPGNCPNSFVTNRTWTFVDACGNTSSVSQIITVSDTLAPVTPTAPADITVACSGLVPTMIPLTAIDNCNGSITAQGVDSITAGNCASSYTITRTWTFVDACGNMSSVSQIINVSDTSSPVLPVAPENITVACIADVPPMISLTATDTCAGNITSEGIDSIVPGNCANSYVITRTWSFGDLCGNSASISQTITVNDNVAPVIPAAPADVTVVCSTEVPAMISLTATDNCQGEITVEGVDSIVQGACPNSFIVTRTWTFVDACDNTSSVSQTINVIDNVAPVAPAAPADVTVACSTEVPAMISLTATDNCQGDITIEGVDSVVQGECPNSFIVTRTWTFVDVCGNTSSVSQIINVVDTIAPIVPVAPAEITVACFTEVPAMISLTATDNCQGEITIEGVDSTIDGNCPNSFVLTRTWTFVDACGNNSSVSQTINVIDNVVPVAPAAPADVTVACSTEVPAMVSLTATDNCQGEITVEGVDSTVQGECPNSFIVTRTWTFVDACGNTSSVSQTINVIDNVVPVAPAAPADVTVACSTEVPAMVSLTATDNCQGEITVEGVDSTVQGECPNSFIVTRTWTFVDACGNTSSVSQTINVIDNVAPVAPAAPADVTVACSTEVPAMVSLTATDNCQGEITVDGIDSTIQGECPNSFIVTRTWTFVDVCGNTSSVSQTINVIDNVTPVAPAAPADVTISCSTEVPAMVSLTATDNCQGEITAEGVDVVSNPSEGTCANSFIVTRTWTFVDACGNSSSVSQIITVNDDIAPILTNEDFVSEMTVTCSEVPAVPELVFTDNCNGTVVVDYNQVTANEVTDENNLIISYDIIRTWTAVDTCDNSTIITQTIHVTVGDTFNAGTKSLCSNDTANAAYNLNQLLVDFVGDDELDGQWTIENVGFESALSGNILNVTLLPVGFYTLVYTLDTNDSFCPRRYEFYIQVQDDCGVLAECSINIFNAVSPNNDGLNEVFYIDGITCYLENNVKIYNRWGVLVYDENGYNNADVAFDGLSEGRTTFNKGEQLPDGTYFYILKYKSNETGAWLDRSGYLYLNR